MTYWNLIIVSACALLLIVLLWKEVRRPNKALLVARILSTIVAVTGLACIGLPLSYQQQLNRSSAKATVLLTKDFEPDSLNAFFKENDSLPVFTIEKKYASIHYEYIPDVDYFRTHANDFNAIHILGNGLEEDELSSIKNIPVIFHPTPVKRGITSISWNQQLKSGEKLRVQGHFKNDHTAPAKITLYGFDAGLDSVLIPAGESRAFQLTTLPKHLDKAVYAITVVSGKDTLENEPLPVEVISPTPVKILLLSSSPDFENKFLRNWLAENNYGVAARTRISTGKLQKDYYNSSTISLDHISAPVLNQFDLLIADATELSALTRPEMAAIQSAIHQQGMGLVVKVDSSIHSGVFYTSAFPLMQIKSDLLHEVKLLYTDDSSYKPPVIKTYQPFYIREQPGTQPLVRNERSEILVSSKMQGLGRMIVTTLNNTYTWQLAGKGDAYSSFWTSLLQKVAKRTVQEETFTVSRSLPVINEKVKIKLQSSIPETPEVTAGAAIINPEQNYQLPFLWQAYYWPVKTGWVPLLSRGKTINWIYVFNESNWQYVRSENKKNATRKYVAGNDATVKSALSTQLMQREIPKVYFFILFLLAASFLWFEKKFNRA